MNAHLAGAAEKEIIIPMDTKQKADIEKAILQTLDEYFAVVARRDVKRFLSFFLIQRT